MLYFNIKVGKQTRKVCGTKRSIGNGGYKKVLHANDKQQAKGKHNAAIGNIPDAKNATEMRIISKLTLELYKRWDFFLKMLF